MWCHHLCVLAMSSFLVQKKEDLHPSFSGLSVHLSSALGVPFASCGSSNCSLSLCIYGCFPLPFVSQLSFKALKPLPIWKHIFNLASPVMTICLSSTFLSWHCSRKSGWRCIAMRVLTAHADCSCCYSLPLYGRREDRLSVVPSDFLIPKFNDHFQVLCSRIFYFWPYFFLPAYIPKCWYFSSCNYFLWFSFSTFLFPFACLFVV